MNESVPGTSYSTPFGDYDLPDPTYYPPSSKQIKLSPVFPFNEFSKLQLVGRSSRISSDDSEGFKNDPFDFDNKLLVSEDEKKRIRNTEAARRCREKIKRRTEELEEELNVQSTRNGIMNQQRIRLLSQIGEQMRMLDMLKKRDQQVASSIDREARDIVDKYTFEVKAKRKAIADYYSQNSNQSF